MILTKPIPARDVMERDQLFRMKHIWDMPTGISLAASRSSADRFIGVDIGAETLKAVELIRSGGTLACGRRTLVDHAKDPGSTLLRVLAEWGWKTVRGAAVSGRLSRQVNLPHVPVKQALVHGYRFYGTGKPVTIVSLGNHGFAVLELRDNGTEVLRENSRCAQGTGNFLRQLVERFALSVEEASEICADVANPAPLSGRCPVILKTDVTHLANKGESRERILAGLFDAVCQNVFPLIKPAVSPADVLLVGGVSLSRRVQKVFREFLEANRMNLHLLPEEDALFLEALGNAAIAAEASAEMPALERIWGAAADAKLAPVPPLTDSLPKVKRTRSFPKAQRNGVPLNLMLGFDIGSTGSKLTAVEISKAEIAWEGYGRTNGDPVGAAQALMGRFLDEYGDDDRILGFGVTGSGREIVGSLLHTCYGENRVFVLNEIAAHAEGAIHYDVRVDTIFEIGGQDAKYIRLEDSRIVDCAMNEACSAGTGSFIEEQGQRFGGIRDVADMGREALDADEGVSLGQHCSVFMAEIIDDAVAAGLNRKAIIAGLYDSIVQNYLHRVKGNRSVGKVIFCQGMPFAADALAAAVARQTGCEVIVPPNPGTVGALGIALLARRALPWGDNQPVVLRRFQNARIEHKETFICKSNSGCGGAGNFCRIDSIRTLVAGQRLRFSWGGSCSLYDKGTRKKKLPDRSPDPFRERENLALELFQRRTESRGLRTVALTDEFILKGLGPFFVTFLHELGLDPVLCSGGDQAALKQGIRSANVPFCAPMQLYHGMATRMAEQGCDLIFLPMLRGIPPRAGESDAVTCPIVQGSSDVIRWDLDGTYRGRVVSPVIDFTSGGIRSQEFFGSCRRLAADLGFGEARCREAHSIAASVQQKFEEACIEIGRKALAFCREKQVPAIVVLGRPYTIYNKVLNSNVPAILREQGVLAIPIDCYPPQPDVPVFTGMYWGYGQRILRAAHQVRRADGVYGVYCSNYSCGPDSFNLHFCRYVMEGKPFTVIETDGHSGDAGTKTRIEAFLYCVAEDRKSRNARGHARDFSQLQIKPTSIMDTQPDECLLIARLGAGSDVAAAAFAGLGLQAEVLPVPDAEMLKLGRRYTSGKECVPMCLTLGSLLGRLESEKATNNRFVVLMPSNRGPCRFGTYSLLYQVLMEELGWKNRIRICSPQESDYFKDMPAGFSGLFMSGIAASDLLLAALLDVRPAETHPGAAEAVYRHYLQELLNLVARESGRRPSLSNVTWQVASGRIFGIAELLSDAAGEFARVRGEADLPTVAVVGEIYVRVNPFANDSVIERLESHGIRTRLAPLSEWIEYTDYLARLPEQNPGLSRRFQSAMQQRILGITAGIFERRMGLECHHPVTSSVEAAAPYLSQDLWGEAVLTLGFPMHEWSKNRIHGIVNLGPLECMPTKIAEAQFFHMTERQKTLAITIPFNGDPLDPQIVENFSYEVHERYRQARQSRANHSR